VERRANPKPVTANHAGANTEKGNDPMNQTKEFSPAEALAIGNAIGVDWNRVPLEQFRMGLAVELEHGRHDPQTNVTDNDLITTGKIALAHLNELPDYYTRLARMESGAGAQPAAAPGAYEPMSHAALPGYAPAPGQSTFWAGLVTGVGLVLLSRWALKKDPRKEA
jgi:hypothetical protein